jgi:hypothetical protein
MEFGSGIPSTLVVIVNSPAVSPWFLRLPHEDDVAIKETLKDASYTFIIILLLLIVSDVFQPRNNYKIMNLL